MPKPPNHALIADKRRERFLEELSEHQEDSANSRAIGSNDELIQTFNMYATSKRNQKIAIILTTGLISFGIGYLIQMVLSDNGALQVLMAGFFIPAAILIAPFYLLAGTGIPSLIREFLSLTYFDTLLLGTVVNSLGWMLIIGFVLFFPSTKFYALLKRNS